MGRKKSSPLPGRIEALRKRLTAWRRGRKRGERIPDALWRKIAEAARSHGVYRISRDLGVNYDTLKKRVAGADLPEPSGRTKKPVFVDLGVTAHNLPIQLPAVELQDRNGNRLTIPIETLSPAQIVSIATTLWEKR